MAADGDQPQRAHHGSGHGDGQHGEDEHGGAGTQLSLDDAAGDPEGDGRKCRQYERPTHLEGPASPRTRRSTRSSRLLKVPTNRLRAASVSPVRSSVARMREAASSASDSSGW